MKPVAEPPSWEEFESLCERCGKTKAGLARELGVSRQSVHRWKVGGVPLYAGAYLRLLVEYNRVRP